MVCLDLMGPLTVNTQIKTKSMPTLTKIDLATRLILDIININLKTTHLLRDKT
jgi:hypothetical protein